jgi:succinoglycan biosynthesis transport protein ExoP
MATADRLLPMEMPKPAGGPLPPAVIEAEFTETAPRHLRDYLRLLIKYRSLAAGCLALMVGLSMLLTLLTTPLYTAFTRLQVARQSPIQLQLEENVLRVEENDRNVNGTSSFLATQVATLKSRDLAERVIRGQHLADNDAFLSPGPSRRGLFAMSGRLLTLLRPRGWDASSAASSDAAPAAGEVDPKLIDRYMTYLSVQDVRGTDLIEVRFTTPDPSLSAFLAAAHTQAYIEANEEARRATDVTAKEFLGRQIRESRDQVESAEAALAHFAAEHPNVAVNQEQKTVAQRITDVSSGLSKAEETRVGLQSRYDFLTAPTADPLAYFLDRPGVQKLHMALLDLRAERAGLGERLGPNHPQMAERRRHESEIEQQLRGEVAQETAGLRARLEAATLREEALRRKLGHLEEASISLRELGSRYEVLKSDVETRHGLHASLLKQQMETAVNSELTARNVRVVERPDIAQRPSTPKLPLNLTLGFLAGLVMAGAAVLLCDYFDNSVKSSAEVELLQLPMLGTIPNFALARRASSRGPAGGDAPQDRPRIGQDPGLIVLNEPRSPAAEAFRALRTAVLFSTPAAPPKVIMVTSAGASEGKTVTSVNLASSLAEGGSRVLLVDVDLRRPRCHHVLGVTNDRGLSSFLAGQAEFESVVHVVGDTSLSFVPAGATPPNPAELVGSARMRDAVEQLRDRYDFVILDSPPVLPVTDAVVLGREADGVVLVVKGYDTPRELVRRARDQLLHASVHLLGAVVNNVDLNWGDHYFYNRYYGYGGYYGPAESPQIEGRA